MSLEDVKKLLEIVVDLSAEASKLLGRIARDLGAGETEEAPDTGPAENVKKRVITININDNGVAIPSVNLNLRYDEFPRLVRSHLIRWPETAPLESLGASLADQDFPEDKLPEFIEAVCKWGGYAGIAGRVLKRNPLAEIAAQFRCAAEHLAADPVRIGLALAAINQLNGLGEVSFASKHLRFIDPAYCPVLDSLIADAFGWPSTVEGYQEFAEFCFLVGAMLKKKGIANPRKRAAGLWFAADVEMAFYMTVPQLLRQCARL